MPADIGVVFRKRAAEGSADAAAPSLERHAAELVGVPGVVPARPFTAPGADASLAAVQRIAVEEWTKATSK